MWGYINYEVNDMENCPHCKKDPRSDELVDNLLKRLKKISGQMELAK